MTTLETALSLLLFFLAPAVVWLAVDTWALRRDVNRLDKEIDSWGRRLWDHHLRIAALEDAHDTNADLDVPHVDTHPDTTHRQENPDA